MRLPNLCIVVFAALLPVSASAAPDAANRGFPIGEKSRIHTNLDVGVAFDSNPARAGGTTTVDLSDAAREIAGPDEIGDVKLQVRPELLVDVPGRSFSMSAGAKFSLEQFFGIDDKGDSSTKFGGDFRLGLTAGGDDSTFGLEVYNALARTPTFFDGDVIGDFESGQTPGDFARGTSVPQGGASQFVDGADTVRHAFWSNRGRLNVVIRPGGGALEFRLGYINAVTIYDGLPDDQSHGIGLEAKLRFLPRTAALFAADFNFYDVTNDEAANPDPTDRAKANPYSVSLGLQGQLTEQLSAIARVGFGDALTWKRGEDFFGEADPDVQRTVIARLLLTWAFDAQKNIWLGYDRAVVSSPLVRSFVTNAIHLGTTIGIGEKFTFRLAGELDLRDYATERTSAMRLRGDARIEYWFFDYLKASLIYQIGWQDGENAHDGVLAVNDYTKHVAMVVVGFRY